MSNQRFGGDPAAAGAKGGRALLTLEQLERRMKDYPSTLALLFEDRQAERLELRQQRIAADAELQQIRVAVDGMKQDRAELLDELRGLDARERALNSRESNLAERERELEDQMREFAELRGIIDERETAA